jgi:hypothetical protein
VQKTILNPPAARALVPALAASRNPDAWVYRYAHPNGWRLSIATHAEPASGKLSLGGFRIAPEERTSAPGFDSDVEAIGLAMGMEEKVHWSRVVGVAGPLTRKDIGAIVGGKCVLHPTPDARVGQPRDRELLDFAVACLADCEKTAGIRITTGQDLGHGTMSDGKTPSLDYLHRGFAGSVVADTSKPTAEGNYHVLLGMLRAFGVAPKNATIGLVGAGNIGSHIVERLFPLGAKMVVIERDTQRVSRIRREGITGRSPFFLPDLLRADIDALVLNAAGGSLSTENVRVSAANDRLKVICGSENLVMPHPQDAEMYRRAGKSYCPTELSGMMGYLTALEQYLAGAAGKPFDIQTMMAVAAELEDPAYRATKYQRDNDFGTTFEQAIAAVSS